jgi:hypothetical protein
VDFGDDANDEKRAGGVEELEEVELEEECICM